MKAISIKQPWASTWGWEDWLKEYALELWMEKVSEISQQIAPAAHERT